MPSLARQHSQDEAADTLIAASSASSNAYNSDTTNGEGPSITADLSEYDRNMGRFGLPSRPARDTNTIKSYIDIKVDTPFLTLRGIGPDVEATHLSGNVELFLAETTSIKEITLEFRGKARVPVPGNESLISNSTSLTYSVCNHTWSFLDLQSGTRHVTSRTLKAGRHLFPFSLEIGGSLPSSISVPLCGASVSYKLHALAALPTKLHIPFQHNLHHTTPITILRSFADSALEYQQTLEIENTWPGKLMYSIVLPHKAWAQGDTLGVLVKFSPTAKGVGVHSVLTNIEEKTRVYARSGEREEKRIVASAKHEILGKRAVLVDTNKPGLWIGYATPPRSPAPATPSRGPERVLADDLNPSNNLASSSSQHLYPQSAAAESSSIPDPEEDPSSTTNPHASPTDIVTTLLFPLPSSSPTMIPSHSLDPITVTHRIRWAIYISNPDGHISELRCSLPIIIMDGRLLAESRMHTAVTRRSVLSSGGMVASAIAGTSDSEGDGGLAEPVEGGLEDRELPSYHAHVRDRVGNMYFPEGAMMRVNNPWVTNGTSPTSPSTPGFGDTVPITGMFDGALNDRLATGNIWGTGPTPENISADPSDAQGVVNTNEGRGVAEPSGLTVSAFSASLTTLHLRSPYPTPPLSLSNLTNIFARPRPTSGHATPQELTAGHVMLHLPHAPGNGESTPLDWVNSELLLSLSDEPHKRFEREIEISRRGCVPSSGSASASNSRGPSRPMTPVGGESRPSNSHGKHGFSGFLKGAMKGFGFTKHHPHSQSGSGAASGAPSPGSMSRTNSRTDSPDLDRPVGLPPTRNMSTGVQSISAVLPSPFQYGSFPASNQGGPGSGVSMPRSVSTSMLSSMAQPVPPTTLTPPVTPSSNPNAAGTSELHHRTSNNDRDEHLLHRAFTEVPDYAVAARGFIGGVAPLSSLVGLPSYADVTRERAREATSRL